MRPCILQDYRKPPRYWRGASKTSRAAPPQNKSNVVASHVAIDQRQSSRQTGAAQATHRPLCAASTRPRRG
eukprot:6184191-Pleurochrysis_carterae.AAC.1